MTLSTPTNLGWREQLVLAHMVERPDQRIVWQFADEPGDDGHQVCGQAAYFRKLRADAPRRQLTQSVFRRLQAGGWIVPAGLDSYLLPEQVEFVLSSAALRRFEALAEWRRWREAYRAMVEARS